MGGPKKPKKTAAEIRAERERDRQARRDARGLREAESARKRRSVGLSLLESGGKVTAQAGGPQPSSQLGVY